MISLVLPVYSVRPRHRLYAPLPGEFHRRGVRSTAPATVSVARWSQSFVPHSKPQCSPPTPKPLGRPPSRENIVSFFDRAALRAIQAGRKAEEFEAAAQLHANATWGSLILGALVWYFASILWATIPLAFAAFSAAKSVSATIVAQKLRKLGY